MQMQWYSAEWIRNRIYSMRQDGSAFRAVGGVPNPGRVIGIRSARERLWRGPTRDDYR